MTKKFSPAVLVCVLGAVLLLVGTIYIISANLTGNTVVPNSLRCMDTDGGQAYDLPGRCLQYRTSRGKIERSVGDECLTTKTLIEYYCNSPALGLVAATCTGQVVNCPNRCSVTESGSFCN